MKHRVKQDNVRSVSSPPIPIVFFAILISGLQRGVIRPDEPYGLPLNFTTLPQKLKEAGMKT